MKRGTPRHPKISELSAALNIPRYAAVGLLEMMWHFTAEFARPGDIGRHKNESIAEALKYKGDPGELIRCLVASGWIDPCECHRLRVHDWPDHADQTVQRVLANRGESFLACYDTKDCGFLYLARQNSEGGPVKIGWSEKPQARIAELQTASPYPITLLTVMPGSRSDEAALHAKFKKQRIHREWFKCTKSILLSFGLDNASMKTSLPLPLPLPLPKANTKTPRKSEREYSADVHRLCELLLSEMKKGKYGCKETMVPNGWLIDMDRLLRIDKKKPERAEQIIKWACHHHFWYKNVRSAGKLRKQFDRLEMDYNDEHPARSIPSVEGMSRADVEKALG